MGQSLVQNYIHIVFGTKYRQPLIHLDSSEELYKYLGGICNNMECTPLKIGGYTDHVHILCRLSKKVALMKLVEELKSHSSKWMKTRGPEFANFYWQDGYGAFSVDTHRVERVSKYIARQVEHHRSKDFQNEYLGILRANGVEYDERYIWN